MEWIFAHSPVNYPDAISFMEERVEGIHTQKTSECVWLLEHPSLYTAGTSAKAEDLLNSRFPVYETGRGGQYTYHGPGQRVAYVLLDLKKRQEQPDLKLYIHNLEEWIIQTLRTFDVVGERREGRVGIWVDHSPRDGLAGGIAQAAKESKIAAIGVRVRHWITYHGVAINVNPQLEHFDGIIPCGVRGAGVCSLASLGLNVTMDELDAALQSTWAKVME
jgi:lipoyl(octanoyl) transferase